MILIKRRQLRVVLEWFTKDQGVEGSNPSECTIKNKELRALLMLVTPYFLCVFTKHYPPSERYLSNRAVLGRRATSKASNGKLRDELLNREFFTTLEEAQVLKEGWHREYYQVRPYSAVGYKPPAPEAVSGPLSETAF